MTLEDGLYFLPQDVTNPKPDRRSTDWQKQPSWKANDRFVVKGGYIFKLGARYYNTLPNTTYDNNNVRWESLAAKLVPCKERDLLATLQYHPLCDAYYILEELLKFGKIRLADVDEACLSIEESDGDDPEYFEDIKEPFKISEPSQVS